MDARDQYSEKVAEMTTVKLVAAHRRAAAQEARMSISHELWETTVDMLQILEDELTARLDGTR